MGTGALVVGSVAFALALGEAAVRFFLPHYYQGRDPIQNPFWHHDPLLGWRHEPGARGVFAREEFSHPVTINSARP